jgi:hypothetical protein
VERSGGGRWTSPFLSDNYTGNVVLGGLVTLKASSCSDDDVPITNSPDKRGTHLKYSFVVL